MAFNGERIDITYDDQCRITQLDAYVPELDDGEIAISIDLHEFSIHHPLRGGTSITQEVYDIEDDEHGYMVPQISRTCDTLRFAEGLGPVDIAESDDVLLINQHVGKLGYEAVAIAVSTYDIAEATLDAPEALEEPSIMADLLDEYGSNVN